MQELLQSPSTQQALLLCVLAAGLGLVAYFLVRKLRGSEEEDQVNTSDMLTKFREMHAEGVLSDEEYRTIKTNLSAQLQNELKDNEETG